MGVRTCAASLLALAGLACSSTQSQPGSAGDSGVCTPILARPVDVQAGCLRDPVEIAACARELLPESPSAGLYTVCICGPDGAIYMATLGGSKDVVGQGWAHSQISLTPSTLSGACETSCDQALNVVSLMPDTGPVCGQAGTCPVAEPKEAEPCAAPGLSCNGWGTLSCPETAACGADGIWRITCPPYAFGSDSAVCGCAHPGG